MVTVHKNDGSRREPGKLRNNPAGHNSLPPFFWYPEDGPMQVLLQRCLE
jgi:hypothetical protein